ncbi:deSI-like protein sdu1 [Magnolia sinica]|uniref:deSI-like protein sdu1 n=1 Tax=Magnolia sinica TaxID=86752 RepID=UPI00265AC0B1|nr:deSI-like protein sdu1 [Magnolia sinica]
MKKVVLHVYDVTNSASPKTNNTILHINKIFKDAIGLGGIFHSAVQVYGDEEWSFGFCETGSGVFSCPPTRNPMYTYRESIVLGETDLPNFSVNQILRELSREWPGTSYDLLSKNCNHFCDELCEKLGVPKLPAWVNRFANAGDAAMEVAGNTALRWRQAKTEIVTASKVAYRFLAGITSNSPVAPESTSNSNRVTTPRFQGAWFKSIASFNARPSSSSEVPNLEEETRQYHQRPRPTEQWRCSSDGI